MGLFTRKDTAHESRKTPGQITIPLMYTGGFSFMRALEQNPTVFACESLIANSIASLPVNLLFRMNDGSRIKAFNHELYSLLKYEPNSEETPQTFYSRMISHILRGNAYILPIKKAGKVVSLWLLDPRGVEVKRLETGEKIFKYGTKRTYGSDEIIHIPGVGYDGLKGYSPLEFARTTLEVSANIDEFAARSFSSRISSRLTVDITQMYPEGASTDDVMEVAKYLKNNYAGIENEGKPLIGWDGMKFDKLEASDNRQAQLAENRAYQNKLIAQIYKVPLFLLGEGENKYNNQEFQNTNFLRYTLMPWIKLIEQYLAKLLIPYERERYFIEINTDGFLRGDTTTRFETYVKGLLHGIYSPDEVRALENMQALPEAGDTHFFPANTMPLNSETINAYMATAKQKMQDSSGIGDDKK